MSTRLLGQAVRGGQDPARGDQRAAAERVRAVVADALERDLEAGLKGRSAVVAGVAADDPRLARRAVGAASSEHGEDERPARPVADRTRRYSTGT